MPEATLHRLVTLEGHVQKLNTDMYFGDGMENPPMTVRVADLEKSLDEFLKNSRDTRIMMLSTMATVIGGIVTAFICYKLGIRI